MAIASQQRTSAPTSVVARKYWNVVRVPFADLVARQGSNVVARALDVSNSQPSRWLKGTETPSPESAGKISDLINVMTQLSLVWVDEIAHRWLFAPNAHLGGRVPVEVFKLEGAAPLLLAIRAEAAGAYA